MGDLVRYRNMIWDSARWGGLRFRAGDVVICTPPKSGTTWMQTLCAMVILDTVHFDRPLSEISPWLDMQTNSRADIVASLEAQEHRRFIKTHTPLDGVPFDERVTYVCVARDPRDVALSFQHHFANMDLEAFFAARAAAVGLDDLAELGPRPDLPASDPAEQFRRWVDAGAGAPFIGPTLADVLHHLTTFWDRRHLAGVVLFHYGDLLADLSGQLRRLAEALEVGVDEDRIAEFTDAARFERMRDRADVLVPDVGNRIWHSNADFFHHGTSGRWRDLLGDADCRHYRQRVAELISPDLDAWAHGGSAVAPAEVIERLRS